MLLRSRGGRPGPGFFRISRALGHVDAAGPAGPVKQGKLPGARLGRGNPTNSEAGPHSASCGPEREGAGSLRTRRGNLICPSPAVRLGRSSWVRKLMPMHRNAGEGACASVAALASGEGAAPSVRAGRPGFSTAGSHPFSSHRGNLGSVYKGGVCAHGGISEAQPLTSVTEPAGVETPHQDPLLSWSPGCDASASEDSRLGRRGDLAGRPCPAESSGVGGLSTLWGAGGGWGQRQRCKAMVPRVQVLRGGRSTGLQCAFCGLLVGSLPPGSSVCPSLKWVC